jgi:hypothetical protein
MSKMKGLSQLQLSNSRATILAEQTASANCLRKYIWSIGSESHLQNAKQAQSEISTPAS